MTEEEAKQCWCPFARSGMWWEHNNGEKSYEVAGNRDANGDIDDLSLCIGSKCMAWRWSEEPTPDEPSHAGIIKGCPGFGYCGLAGKP